MRTNKDDKIADFKTYYNKKNPLIPGGSKEETERYKTICACFFKAVGDPSIKTVYPKTRIIDYMTGDAYLRFIQECLIKLDLDSSLIDEDDYKNWYKQNQTFNYICDWLEECWLDQHC